MKGFGSDHSTVHSSYGQGSNSHACLTERKNLHGYVLSGVVTTRHQLPSNAAASVAGSYSRHGICILEKKKNFSDIEL